MSYTGKKEQLLNRCVLRAAKKKEKKEEAESFLLLAY